MSHPKLTDQEHAKAINDAREALNKTIAAANRAGLNVIIGSEEVQTLAGPVPFRKVVTQVSRPVV